jgi:hypothetical protein
MAIGDVKPIAPSGPQSVWRGGTVRNHTNVEPHSVIVSEMSNANAVERSRTASRVSVEPEPVFWSPRKRSDVEMMFMRDNITTRSR